MITVQHIATVRDPQCKIGYFREKGIGMDRNRARRIVNGFLVIAVAGSWLAMFAFGEGALATRGIHSLKYFTTLSNLFAGFAAAIWLFSSYRNSKANEYPDDDTSADAAGSSSAAKTGKASALAERLKYVAAASVGLTCITVLVFLGPLYGYPAMFAGGNLFMHLITPVVAVAEIVFLSDAEYTRKDNLLVIIPPLVYGIFYLGNVFINGLGEWPDYNDWYLFLTWGYPVGILIFAIICVVTWLLGLLMRKMHRKKPT